MFKGNTSINRQAGRAWQDRQKATAAVEAEASSNFRKAFLMNSFLLLKERLTFMGTFDKDAPHAQQRCSFCERRQGHTAWWQRGHKLSDAQRAGYTWMKREVLNDMEPDVGQHVEQIIMCPECEMRVVISFKDAEHTAVIMVKSMLWAELKGIQSSRFKFWKR